jgi:hypothetical protein
MVVGGGCEKSRPAPDRRTEDDQRLARVAVCQKTKEGRGEHVAEEEGCCQKSEIGIGRVEFLFYKRLYGEQNRAVDLVEKIERCQKRKR